MNQEYFKTIYRNINDFMVSKNVEGLAKLLKPNTVLVHMTGYVQPINEWLQQIKSEEMKYYSWEEESIEILNITDKMAIIIGKSRVKARIWGIGPHTWNLKMKMTFEKVDDKWLVSKQEASTY